MDLDIVIEQQLQCKREFNHRQDILLRPKCKKDVSILEKTIRNTLYSSQGDKTTFQFPFFKGCGPEVTDMLKPYKIDVRLNESIDDVDKLYVFFNIEKNNAYVVLDK